jgi:hypothetical protein
MKAGSPAERRHRSAGQAQRETRLCHMDGVEWFTLAMHEREEGRMDGAPVSIRGAVAVLACGASLFASVHGEDAPAAKGARAGMGVPAPAMAGGVPTYKMIVSSHDNHRIIRYEWPGGGVVDHLVAEGVSPLVNPISISLGPGGKLYVPCPACNVVLRYDAQTGKPEGTFGEANFIAQPRQILFHTDGLAYVLSGSGVSRFNAATGAFVDAFVSSGALVEPMAMAFGPNGDLFIANYGNDRVLRYEGETGTLLDTFVEPGSGGLDGPVGLLFTEDGELLVSSENSDSVLKYSVIGVFLEACITPLRGGLDGPRWIRFGPDGDLYVTNRAVANNVLRFSYPECEFLGAAVPSNFATLDGPTDVLFVPDPDAATCPEDVNADGTVDGADLGVLLAGWGDCAAAE